MQIHMRLQVPKAVADWMKVGLSRLEQNSLMFSERHPDWLPLTE